ncbi:MAG: type II secretion system protein GspG [Phycisphaeraceae bacterium]|nr:type II secretion system protein GspG [Phycisphaerales bacterium]MCB9860315.1 type II secretion system protein GspG [Phycisphaeraceae bacterium]
MDITRSTRAPRITRTTRGAFTIVEVMIVLAIVLVLAGLVGVKLFAQRDKANIKITQQQMAQIKDAIKLFKLDFERVPNDEEGIAVLWDKEMLDAESDIELYTKGGYLDAKKETDHWGSEWGYETYEDESSGELTYRLWSFGPDREDGTEDDVRPVGEKDDEESGFGSDGGIDSGGE